MRHAAVAIVSSFLCTVAAAADQAPTKSVSAAAESHKSVKVGAQLKPTQGNSVSGMLNVIAEKKGVRVGGTVEGLAPNSEQAFHVHQKGDCSAPDGSSAGDHFNPTSQQHGNPKVKGPHHLGDMVNLKADGKGTAKVDFFIDGATLHTGDPSDLVGKAIIVHQSPDDYTSQPSGNAGARVACGVIR
jgi:Cu-Zn family superoxide dismutase